MSGLNLEYFLYLIYRFFSGLLAFGRDPSLLQPADIWFNRVWWTFLLVSLPLLAVCVFFIIKINKIRRIERERVYGAPAEILAQLKEDLTVEPPRQNPVWEKVMTLLGSDNPNDWQSAILEADKMLEVVVKTFDVPGDNLGEKLKNIERGDFNTLEEAWQAHKVRNQIAHEHNFHLSQREAKIALNNYEKVFREFDFI